MDSSSPLKTDFAPAERAASPVIQSQVRFFAEMPSLQRELLDAVPNVLMVLNGQRQATYVNAALLKLLGLPDATSVLGQRPGEILNCAHAAEAEYGCGTSVFCRTCGVVRAILSSLEGQKSQRECRIMQRDGSALDLRVDAMPLVIHGETYSIFTVQDIGHEKRRQALERMFFHDLLNLVQVVVGYASLMQESDNLNGNRHYVEIITRAADYLVQEINAQRDLTLAESGDLSVKCEPVESLALLRLVQMFYERHAVAVDRTISIADGAQPAVFVSDPVLLERVIGNMVKNALEACADGDTVTLTCAVKSGWIIFEVHNPQVMPDDVQLQVFKRSFSTKGPGHGLGTYSIKLLGETYLGGRVSFVSTPQSGTIFSAAFPVNPS